MIKLTERKTENKTAFVSMDYCDLKFYDMTNRGYAGRAIDKLAYYEELEESGLLFVIPCKRGDTIYIVDRDNGIVKELSNIDKISMEYDDKDIIYIIDKKYKLKASEIYKTHDDAEKSITKMAVY